MSTYKQRRRDHRMPWWARVLFFIFISILAFCLARYSSYSR